MNLGPNQVAMLRHLRSAPDGRLRVADLCDLLGTDAQSVRDALGKIERHGFVSKRRLDLPNKPLEISITAEGCAWIDAHLARSAA